MNASGLHVCVMMLKTVTIRHQAGRGSVTYPNCSDGHLTTSKVVNYFFIKKQLNYIVNYQK